MNALPYESLRSVNFDHLANIPPSVLHALTRSLRKTLVVVNKRHGMGKVLKKLSSKLRKEISLDQS